MKPLSETTIEELDVLIADQELARPHLNFTDTIRDDLILVLDERTKRTDEYFYNIDKQLLEQTHSPNVCGCMGARPPYSVCNCTLYMNLSLYRFHIAKVLKERIENA